MRNLLAPKAPPLLVFTLVTLERDGQEVAQIHAALLVAGEAIELGVVQEEAGEEITFPIRSQIDVDVLLAGTGWEPDDDLDPIAACNDYMMSLALPLKHKES